MPVLSPSVARTGWPRSIPARDALPPVMPDGRPWPRISVVTPSYNQGGFIEDCILSVLNQGYPDVEHIVMDGGSTDGTRAVLDLYGSRLAHWQSAPDKGQSDAINAGMAKATGSIVTWLNSDDMLAPGALAAAAVGFADSRADIVAGTLGAFHGSAVVFHQLLSVPDGPLPLADLLDLENAWVTGRFFYQPETFFTRDIWDRAGPLRTDLHMCMDYEMWLRFAEAGARIHGIGRPVALFRYHDLQKTHELQNHMPETRGVAEERRQRHGMVPLSEVPRRQPGLGRNLRLAALLGTPPDTCATAGSRLAEAFAEGFAEVTPVVLGDGRPAATLPSEAWRTRILSRIAWTGSDAVLVEGLAGLPDGEALLAALAERWPVILAGADAATLAVPEGARVLRLDPATAPPAVPRPLFEALPDTLAERRRLHVPRDAFCVLCLGAERAPEALAALAATVPDGVVLCTDAPVAAAGVRVLPAADRAALLAAMDAAVALDGRATRQVAAECWAAGLPVVSVGHALMAETDLCPPEARAVASADAAAAVLAGLAADPGKARRIGAGGRLVAETRYTTFAAYRHAFLALRAAGWIDALRLKDKIDFRPEPQAGLGAPLPAWPGL